MNRIPSSYNRNWTGGPGGFPVQGGGAGLDAFGGLGGFGTGAAGGGFPGLGGGAPVSGPPALFGAAPFKPRRRQPRRPRRAAGSARC